MKIKTSMCSAYCGAVCYYFLQQSAKWWRCRKPSKVRTLNRYSSCCVLGTAMKPVYTYASPHAEQLLPSNFWPLTFRSPTIWNYMKYSKNLSPPGIFELSAQNFFHMNFGPIRSDLSRRISFKVKYIFLIIQSILRFYANYSSASKSYMQSYTFMAFGKDVEG